MCSGERARREKTKVTGKKEWVFYEFSLGKSSCRKGSGVQRGRVWRAKAAHLLQYFRPLPAASLRPCSKVPCRQCAKCTHLWVHLSWEGNQEPFVLQPWGTEVDVKQWIFLLPCVANTERLKVVYDCESGDFPSCQLHTWHNFSANWLELMHISARFSYYNILQHVLI